MKTMSELNQLWKLLGDIPTFNDESEDIGEYEEDTIEEPFLHFPIGTHREDIWHWFEEMNPEFLVGPKMNGEF